MILNCFYKTVWDAQKDGTLDLSFCPECNGKLAARFCDVKTSHWFHVEPNPGCSEYTGTGSGERTGTGAPETPFHVTMKQALVNLGYQAEYPISTPLGDIRVDAAKPGAKFAAYVEVVNSLPAMDELQAKAAKIEAAGLSGQFLWLFNFNKFAEYSSRARWKMTDQARRRWFEVLIPARMPTWMIAEVSGTIYRYSREAGWRHENPPYTATQITEAYSLAWKLDTLQAEVDVADAKMKSIVARYGIDPDRLRVEDFVSPIILKMINDLAVAS